MAICLMLIGRICARAYARSRTDFREPTLIVGAGKVGVSVARKLALRPRYGLDVIGFLDDEPLERAGRRPAAPRLRAPPRPGASARTTSSASSSPSRA